MDLFNRQKKKNVTIYAYQRLFASEDGKIVLKDLSRACHLDVPTMSSDPYETAYREGERSVLLRILKTINADPEQLMKLVTDNQEEE
jgi:hypothetical protein